jgi:hypothetical protein
MSRRCPAAVPLGALIMRDTRLVFRGVADVVRAEGAKCPGGIWRITAECERALDRYEGFNPNDPDRGMYSKEYVEIEGLPDGETEIMLYTMNSRGIYPPSDYYYNTLKEGYRDFGLKLAPLRAALEHSYDDKHPSHIERKRTRRMGRPALAPRPAKVQSAPVPLPKQPSEFVYRTKSKPQRSKPRMVQTPPKAKLHDPWGVDCPAEKRRKNSNLTDWLRERFNSGEPH